MADARAPDSAPLRIGIVGAGRTRQGLGPFLARAFVAAGCRVTGVAGRDAAGAERAAGELAAALGAPVTAFADAASLARTVDALVVAAPVPAHLAGLEAALAAGVPCLCEKPLVGAAETDAGLACVAAFRDRGILLVENCQWPEIVVQLAPLRSAAAAASPVRRLAMGLGPGWPGRTMVEDSLSHVLSVLQALVPVPETATVAGVRQDDAGPAATRNVVRFTVGAATGPVAVELHLEHCPEPPRPAWISIDGARFDRRIGEGYVQSFVAGNGRAIQVQDPLHRLVYGFVQSIDRADLERRSIEAAAVSTRLRLYRAVLDALR
jgi:hypothetical protein